MKTRVWISILASFVLAAALFSGCSTPEPNEQKLGNTNANIVNGGISVMRDGWVYFSNIGDNDFMYKVKLDGTGEEKVIGDKSYYLNTSGDWLYYYTAGEKSGICRVKPDGTDCIMIAERVAQNILVADDWIYYVDYTDNADIESSTEYGRIFRMKTDGTGIQKVCEQRASIFNVSGEWLYFRRNDDEKLYRTMTDGTGEAKISDASIMTFCILDDKIYYIDSSDGNNAIWSMKSDGTEAKKLSEDKAMSINASGEWIYYGKYKGDIMDLELKRMKFDGTAVTLINDDDPMNISVHGDLLQYSGMDFTDYSAAQIIMMADGTRRKEYLFVPPAPVSPMEGVEIFKMNEIVKGGGLSVTVVSAYSTNIIESTLPGMESPIFDDVVDGAYLFVNLNITNESENEIDLKQMLGRIMIEEISGFGVEWSLMADVTDEAAKDSSRFHLATDSYIESVVLKPHEKKDIQVFCRLNDTEYPVLLGLFDGTSFSPLAAIEIMPGEERYVTSWMQARRQIEERFQGYEITDGGGIGFKFEGEREERVYYSFEVKKQGASDSGYYLVSRDTGQIFKGAYSPKYPDLKAVPVSIDVQVFSMNEQLRRGDLTLTVLSAYSTNVIEDTEDRGWMGMPTAEGLVSEDAYLFIKMTVTNSGKTAIELKKRFGQIIERGYISYSVQWSPLVDITDIAGTDEPRFHVARDDYKESMIIGTNETRIFQALCWVERNTYPMRFGLFDDSQFQALAEIMITPNEEYYATSWNDSEKIMKQRFPGKTVTKMGGMSYTPEGESEEKSYYGFKIKKQGSTAFDYYCVMVGTGQIYICNPDQKYPDHIIPVKPLD